MLPYKTLIDIDRASPLALHIQICNAFIALITNGTLQPSDVLPGSRVLADLTGLNRNTVRLAYDELVSQGWAEAIERKGIFVLPELPVMAKRAQPKTSLTPPNATSFRWTNRFKNTLPSKNLQRSALTIDDGFPDVRLMPVDKLMREYRSLSRRSYGRNFLKYGSSKGSEHLRKSLAKQLYNTRGVTLSPENMIITKGSQMGVYLAAQLLLNPSDNVAVGLSSYLLADNIFRHCGANLIRITVNEHGMDTDQLEKVLQRETIKAVYVIPHHHCPTTVTMRMERRLKLLKLAQQHKFAIIEDDYDFDFHYENKPYLPLASIDHHQHVIYIGSVTKTLAPALRIGFMTGPAEFIDAAASLRELIDKQGDTVLEEAFATMFDNGDLDAYFRKSLKIYRDRRDFFCHILERDFKDFLTFREPEGGLAVWALFDKKIDLPRMSAAALKSGLYIDDGTFYTNESFNANGLRMGFASLEEKEIQDALQKLKHILLQIK